MPKVTGLTRLQVMAECSTFVSGSFWSKGGKSFICMPSTHTGKDGKVKSRIVPFFKPGTAVTVPRQSVQFIATEYGAVNLKLCPLWMRAEKLISIAHPDFQDELIKSAEENKIWRKSIKNSLIRAIRPV
jgi:Acetyl-CoA hydrolase